MPSNPILKNNPAHACIDDIRKLGPIGPVANSIMLFNSSVIGVTATQSQPQVHVTYFWVSPSERGKGVGRKTMNLVLSVADRHDVAVKIRPAVFDRRHAGQTTGLSSVRLRKWYEGFGFVSYGPNHLYMRRERIGE